MVSFPFTGPASGWIFCCLQGPSQPWLCHSPVLCPVRSVSPLCHSHCSLPSPLALLRAFPPQPGQFAWERRVRSSGSGSAAAPARGCAELSPQPSCARAAPGHPGSDQPLGRGHLDHVPHFHSCPVLLLPARAVGSLSRSPPLHGNGRGYNQCEEQGSPRSPDCSHHGGVAEVRPHSLLR